LVFLSKLKFVESDFKPDPSFLGLAPITNPMIVVMGAQQAPTAVGLVAAGSTKVGPCFHQDPAAVDPIASRTLEKIWVLPPTKPIRVESCPSMTH